MGKVLIKLKVMPESTDTDLDDLAKSCEKVIKKYGEVGQKEIEPIAFGLKGLVYIIVADDAKGGTDPLEEGLSKIKGVNSVEILDVRRAVG